jgi:cold shock CspA family protein
MNNPFEKLKEIAGLNKGESMTENTEQQGDNTEPVRTDERVTGKIIKLHPGGWGFISSKDIKFTRIFFHWSSLRQNTKNFTELKVGMRVEFTPSKARDNQGVRAIKINVIE